MDVSCNGNCVPAQDQGSYEHECGMDTKAETCSLDKKEVGGSGDSALRSHDETLVETNGLQEVDESGIQEEESSNDGEEGDTKSEEENESSLEDLVKSAVKKDLLCTDSLHLGKDIEVRELSEEMVQNISQVFELRRQEGIRVIEDVFKLPLQALDSIPDEDVEEKVKFVQERKCKVLELYNKCFERVVLDSTAVVRL